MAAPSKPPPRARPARAPLRLLSPRRQERVWGALGRAGERPSVQLTGVILFIAALVAIITGGFGTNQTDLTPALTGQRASRDYRATRDFVYVRKNEEATETRRRQVIAQLPPVYDWHEDRGEQVRDAMHQSLEGARERLKQAIAPPDESGGAAVKPPRRRQALTPAPPPATIAELSASQRLELSEPFLDEALSDFPIALSASQREALAALGFSPQLEGDLNALLYQTMNALIVPDARALDENRARGIYLRRLRGDTVLIEYHLLNIDRHVQGLEAARAAARLRAETQFGSIQDDERRATIQDLAASLVVANTRYNEEMTLTHRARAEQAIEEVITREPIARGELIVARGARITAREVELWEQMRQEEGLLDLLQLVLGLVVIVLLTFAILYQYGRQNVENVKFPPKDVAFLCTSTIVFASLVKLGQVAGAALSQQIQGIPLEGWLFFVPVAGFGMLIRLVLRSEHAVLCSIAMATISALIMDQLFLYFAFALLGCLIGAHFVRQVKHRLALMWSGFVVGVVNALVISAELMLRGELLRAESLMVIAMAFGGGLLSGFVVSSLLPIIESTFGYTTDIKLLELSNLNHPLMRQLILRAPGSYHHSMMVGSLCEAAADQIGCNALLCRVGAYYHDIGKTKNPGYFAENQKYGENPHDKLKPNMSALIIKSHVRDGAEMARDHGLPKELIAFIEQHHGTSLIAYFYHRAKELEDPDIPEVDEEDYRYPGPKPQTRETAICLLADGIEAASKAMPNKTPARLKGLVQKMINKAFTDGQLDECDLTLKDLNAIADAFTRILTGIYHHRPEYPSAKRSAGAGQLTRVKHATSPPLTAKPVKESALTLPPAEQEKLNDDDDRGAPSGGRGETSAPSKDQRQPDREERTSLPRLGSP